MHRGMASAAGGGVHGVKTRAVLFARVSNDDQALGFSLDGQVAQMKAECERRGWVVVRIFVEPGTSAFRPSLRSIPELRAAIEEIEGHRADVLVIHESSRLARHELLGQEIINRLEAAGGRLLNIATGMDYHSPEGRLAFTFETGVNAYTSRKISEHSRKGKAEQFRQGFHVGGTPYGYVAGPSRKTPASVVPHEADVVRIIFEDRRMGKGVIEIARDLNIRGVAMRTGRLGRWIPQTVQEILRNRFYVGDVEHAGSYRGGQHEAIVAEELFTAVQAPMQRQSRKIHFPPLLMQTAGSAAAVSNGSIRFGRGRGLLTPVSDTSTTRPPLLTTTSVPVASGERSKPIHRSTRC